MNVKLNLKKEIKTAFEPPLTDALPTAGPGLPHRRAPHIARSPTAGLPALPVALLCPALRPHLTAARASGAERIGLRSARLRLPGWGRVAPPVFVLHCFTLFHLLCLSRVLSLFRCIAVACICSPPFPGIAGAPRRHCGRLAAVRPVLASAVGVCQVCDGEVCPQCSPLPEARTGETPGPAARAGGARPCPQARSPAPPPGGRFLPLHTPLGAFSATRLSKLLGTFCARFGIPGRCVCEFPDPQLYL